METQAKVPTTTPPSWVNRSVAALLRTPGIQRMLGNGLALLTFTGRRSGGSYTIPVSYRQDGDRVTVITKRFRTWWRNFSTAAPVVIRLAGRDHLGTATAITNTADSAEEIAGFLHGRKVDAKAYGLEMRADGSVDSESLETILPDLVLIEITLHD